MSCPPAGRNFLDVLLREHAPHIIHQGIERQTELVVQLLELHRADNALVVLEDDQDVHDADDALLDHVGERRADLPAELIPRELEDEILQWSVYHSVPPQRYAPSCCPRTAVARHDSDVVS